MNNEMNFQYAVFLHVIFKITRRAKRYNFMSPSYEEQYSSP